MVLNVTNRPGFNGWTAYVVLNGLAVPVARADFNGLDDLRYYASREGYDGIQICTCPTDWCKLVRCVEQIENKG